MPLERMEISTRQAVAHLSTISLMFYASLMLKKVMEMINYCDYSR
jgi:hypothetical protein